MMRRKLGLLFILIFLPGGIFFVIYDCFIRGKTLDQAIDTCRNFLREKFPSLWKK